MRYLILLFFIGLSFNSNSQSEAQIKQTVRNLYVRILQRPADENGLQFFSKYYFDGNSIKNIAVFMASSDEFYTKFVKDKSQKEITNNIYNAILARNSDQLGSAYWEARVAKDGYIAVVREMAESDEFKSKFPSYGTIGSRSSATQEFVSILESDVNSKRSKVIDSILITESKVNLYAEFFGVDLKNVNVGLRNLTTGNRYELKNNTLRVGDNNIIPGSYEFFLEAQSKETWKWKAVLRYR